MQEQLAVAVRSQRGLRRLALVNHGHHDAGVTAPFVGAFRPFVVRLGSSRYGRVIRMAMSEQSGFSIIELVVVLVIAGVIAAVAAPNMGIFFKNSARTARINDFVSAIQFARSQAVANNQRVTLCAVDARTLNAAAPSGGECFGSGDDNDGVFDFGWMVFLDNASGGTDGDIDNTERVLRVFEVDTVEGSAFIGEDADGGSVNTVSFLGTGLADGLDVTTYFLYCDDREEPDRSARAIILTGSGQPRLSQDLDGDGVDDLADGDPFSC